MSCDTSDNAYSPGAHPVFQVRGAHLKNLHREEGGTKICGVFRVKNHDFTQKNTYFFPILGGGARRVRPPGSIPDMDRLANKDK